MKANTAGLVADAVEQHAVSRWQPNALLWDTLMVPLTVAGVKLVAFWLLGGMSITFHLDDVSYPTEYHFTETLCLHQQERTRN